MSTPDLTPEQEAHAQELAKVVLKAMEQDVLPRTRLWASKPDHQVLGQAEFQVRDLSIRAAPRRSRPNSTRVPQKLPGLERDLPRMPGRRLVPRAS